MDRYLLDADIAIYAVRGHARVAEHLRSRPDSWLGISAIVHSQLLQGVTGRPNASREVSAILGIAAFVPYDEEASLAYGRIVGQLGFERRHMLDRMIAAHAISLGAIMVTNNVRDFTDVPGLTVENWSEPAL